MKRKATRADRASLLAAAAGIASCAPAANPSPPVPPPSAAASCEGASPNAGARNCPPADPGRDEALHPSPYDARGDGEADAELVRTLAQTRNFRLGAPTHATLTADGKTVLFLRSGPRDPKQSLFAMDVASGDVRELATPEALLAGPETLSPEERVRRERMRVGASGFTSLEASDDGALVLVTLSGRVFAVDRASGKARELPTGAGAAIDPRLSPDATHVAYVRADDLHVVPLAGGHETAVTHGGTERVTHGLADFIAQEELSRYRGFWWSPDGKRLLFEEADTTKVDVLTIADPFRAEQPAQHIAYPRPGRPNAELRFGIVAATGGPTTWVQWDRARFPYVAQASWPKGGPPLLFVLDRLQQQGLLLAVDAATGATRVLVEERDPAWVNVDPSVPRWLPDGKGFLWASERSGEWQLELRDASGARVRELTPKGFGYASLAVVDDARRTAMVVASPDPTEATPWLVSLDGSAPPRRMGGEGALVHVGPQPARPAYVTVEESLSQMPRTFVRSVDGAAAREIPTRAESPREMPGVELAEVGPDRAHVAIVRPHGFRPDRRYPVVDAAYGGPHAQMVTRSALSFVRAQWVADATGAIVVSIDARGTPRRGRDWERAIHLQLGSVPVEGHVAALHALGDRYPEMDTSRVGVYGWSFGGYFAAMAVLARPDVYRVGVAGAPPADWRDYDTAYTERYLGLPETQAAAYDAASLLTHVRAPAGQEALRLLVVHGTADDNVWFLNSVKLADALERAHRPFDFLPLAGTTHMLLDPQLAEEVWVRTARHLREGLHAPR